MAQQIITSYVDDLDGSEAQGPVVFGIDGWTYKIDLSETNAKELREFLARYVDAAERLPRKAASAAQTAPTRQGGRTTTDRAQTQAIRDWARANGHTVNDRGRIPKPVVEAFQAAH